MSKRSLKASEEGAKLSRRAFERRGWTQEYLAAEVNLKTRQPIWRFFTRRPIERHTFIEICDVLDLNWWEVAENSPSFESDSSHDWDEPLLQVKKSSENLEAPTLSEFVQHVRSQYQQKIQAQCGEIVIFNSNRRLALNDIYIDVDLLERPDSQPWYTSDILDAVIGLSWQTTLKYLAQTRSVYPESSLQALDRYQKVRVLGQFGSGKTTLLHHVALECIQGRFLADHIPIFITLEKLARYTEGQEGFNLLSYVCKEFQPYGLEPNHVESLLQDGRLIFLLDGLDEIGDCQTRISIAKEIDFFSEDYFRNRFIVTCRTGSQTYQFLKFTDLEIADLTESKIEEFIQKCFMHWPQTLAGNEPSQPVELIHQINLPENWQIKDLARNPLLLSQICLAFQQQKNVLSQREKFYRYCFNLFLKDWSRARGIQRDLLSDVESFHKLNVLSQLAADMLQQQKYLLAEEDVKACINKYLIEQIDRSFTAESLLYMAEHMLESMTIHHGVLVESIRGGYSFSYAAFQDYLISARGSEVLQVSR